MIIRHSKIRTSLSFYFQFLESAENIFLDLKRDEEKLKGEKN
jgi:hypothetical protein